MPAIEADFTLLEYRKRINRREKGDYPRCEPSRVLLATLCAREIFVFLWTTLFKSDIVLHLCLESQEY